MAVAAALAEVLVFPDVAFDAAAAAQAMDAMARQPPPPASASSSTSMEDERAPLVNTTATKRGLPVGFSADVAAPAAQASESIGELMRADLSSIRGGRLRDGGLREVRRGTYSYAHAASGYAAPGRSV